MLKLDMLRNINDFPTDLQDIRINLEEYKVFEIIKYTTPISHLPAGATEPRLDTEIERINHKTPESQFSSYKNRIAGVMIPKDPEQMQKIETKMALNKLDHALKDEYQECLKKCVCLELVQISNFHMTKQGDDDNQISSITGDAQKGKAI